MALDVHVVTHTHWDREWYQPLERFRQRLVDLVDELLDDPPELGQSFLLDGQGIVLEDYLAVRPERFDELRALLADGRLEAGPWFVLADELIPSGESIVRNLLAGARVLKKFGAASPPVLYCPDSFGHPAILPSIAAGFGLPMIILWRGFGGDRSSQGDTFRWASPAGDEVVVYHLPRDGYEYGSHLPADEAGARERWTRMRNELAPRATTGVILIPNGADHHARQRSYRQALSALEQAGADDVVRRSSLTNFARSLVERTAAQRLPLVRGELRDSYGYTWTLQGTFATRAHEKRANAKAERLLVREAEPWSALAARTSRSRRPLVEMAWRTLLEAHPHDTLCGCSIDEVAAAMELRVRSAANQAEGIRDDSILDLIGHDAVTAREARERWRPLIVLRNAAARRRAGVAIIELEEFVADVGVGPGAGSGTATATATTSKPTIAGFSELQVLSRALQNRRTESARHYPDNDLVQVTRVAAWVPEISAYGIQPAAIEGSSAGKSRMPDRVKVGARSIDSVRLLVDVDESGNVSLEDRATGRRIGSLLSLIDEADVGDTYTPAPRPRAYRAELRRVRRVDRGPLIGTLALSYRILDSETRKVDALLEVRLSLRAGEPFLRVGVSGENHRENHRLRLRFAGDVANPTIWADAAFGPTRRDRIAISEQDALKEHAPPTAPLHRYVSAFGEGRGVTVFSDGLAEYQAFEDGGFAVTLIRSVGELSRNDLPERPGHAGWPTPTPAAQCLGPFTADFAVMMHGPRMVSTISAIEAASDDFLLPIVGTTLRSAIHLPEPVAGPELVGDGLAVSAIKQSEDGQHLVLRCVNLGDESASGAWKLPFTPAQAHQARIDETVMSVLEIDGDAIPVVVPPRGILTILVR